jgi:hypothetical protein
VPTERRSTAHNAIHSESPPIDTSRPRGWPRWFWFGLHVEDPAHQAQGGVLEVVIVLHDLISFILPVEPVFR